MIPFAVLWLLVTVGLQLTIQRMSAWVEVTAVTLYSTATLYGMLYWNVRVAEWWEKRRARNISTDS